MVDADGGLFGEECNVRRARFSTVGHIGNPLGGRQTTGLLVRVERAESVARTTLPVLWTTVVVVVVVAAAAVVVVAVAPWRPQGRVLIDAGST